MPGGGIQYKLTQSVQWYKDMGYLEEVSLFTVVLIRGEKYGF